MPRPFVAGGVLIAQGIWHGTLFLLRSGIVQISREAEAGHDPEQGGVTAVPLRRPVAGECFGEMSLITNQPPSATARALTDGEVWTLDQATFQRLVATQPELSRNITAILSEPILFANRQQGDAEPAQVIVGVGGEIALWKEIALLTARLSSGAVLLADLTAADGRAEPTLADLRAGRIRPAHGERLTAVRGLGSDDLAELPALLGRLDERFPYQFVILPPGHRALSPQLVT